MNAKDIGYRKEFCPFTRTMFALIYFTEETDSASNAMWFVHVPFRVRRVGCFNIIHNNLIIAFFAHQPTASPSQVPSNSVQGHRKKKLKFEPPIECKAK